MSKYIDEEKIIEMMKPKIKGKISEIYNDIKSYADTAIDSFYGDYSPKIYERDFCIFNIGSGAAYNIGEIKNGYELTITFSSGALNGNAGQKFEGPFVQGYHGPPWGKGGAHAAPQMQPSPWNSILSYAQGKYNAVEV